MSTRFVLLGALLLVSACTDSRHLRVRAEPAPSPYDRLEVLMINGGGTPPQNYQSHLLHVQQLLAFLQKTGMPLAHVSVFASDGEDPGLDLAYRELNADGFWRLRGTSLSRTLGEPIRYRSTELPGMRIEAATKENLRNWFAAAGERLRPGETLVLYVTDHGNRNAEDLKNNTITLWGEDESISVSELRDLLAMLDPGIRVVALMSQCFSGSFAHLADAHSVNGLPGGNVCGYFSSTASLPAYGCYPENRGRENVGHSFHFLNALANGGSFPGAHADVLATDATPDVPLRTTDVYLEDLLAGAAAQRDVPLETLVDELLAVAWKDKARWEPEIRLLDRIGTAFGCFSPRSLAEIETQIVSLSEISGQLREVAQAWRGTLGDANAGNVGRFVDASPRWQEDKRILQTDLADEERRRLAKKFLGELESFTATEPQTEATLSILHNRATEADATAYRMQVRLGALMRMRTILTTVAGRVYLDEHGEPAEREAYTGLLRCEDLHLPTSSAAPMLAALEPFPPFDEDVHRARAALPAWMGIRFQDVSPDLRERHALPSGASTVVAVYSGSPAETAGLEPGDIITGAEGRSFTERRQVRKFTMLSSVGEERTLNVLRGGEARRISFVPEPFPLEPPPLPGPPRAGTEAPPLRVASYRGTAPETLREGEHLLFFWATWCLPCKASVPELLEFEAETGVPVLAVTDEPADQLDKFFDASDVFPKNVAIDEYRSTFLAYGVSGTPTFVHVGADGRVRSYSSGYAAEAGLQFDGWKRSAR